MIYVNSIFLFSAFRFNLCQTLFRMSNSNFGSKRGYPIVMSETLVKSPIYSCTSSCKNTICNIRFFLQYTLSCGKPLSLWKFPRQNSPAELYWRSRKNVLSYLRFWIYSACFDVSSPPHRFIIRVLKFPRKCVRIYLTAVVQPGAIDLQSTVKRSLWNPQAHMNTIVFNWLYEQTELRRRPSVLTDAGVAQLVEQLIRNQQVKTG